MESGSCLSSHALSRSSTQALSYIDFAAAASCGKTTGAVRESRHLYCLLKKKQTDLREELHELGLSDFSAHLHHLLCIRFISSSIYRSCSVSKLNEALSYIDFAAAYCCGKNIGAVRENRLLYCMLKNNRHPLGVCYFFGIRQLPILPCRLQHSTVGV